MVQIEPTKKPLIVGADGIDNAGKTIFLLKLKKSLQKTLDLKDEEIGIVKFEIKELDGDIRKLWEGKEALVNALEESEILFWKMRNYVEGEVNTYQNAYPGKKIILLDRSIFSFVMNWGQALGFNKEKISKLWTTLQNKLPVPDVFVHVTADSETITERFKKTPEDKLSYMDKLTKKDIPGSLKLYEDMKEQLIKDKTIQLDTSGMIEETAGDTKAYTEQLQNIVSFIINKYEDELR